ncbi:MAG TPA: hypothetical protein VK735_37205 [Pseudonocardia sp.]|jgi:hypothetical protein|uniref:hypothetical protein n=1 Tax=Pseudonocardia sp. TaxID=60912 RepID=UPI002CB41919|nr:hypothetical protein [Pseudonocardia sp.]HTF53119.1 hypothetical protein [Pseudonocardia sp.]
MNEFRTQLRARINDASAAVSAAWRAGNDDEAHLYAARLAEFLELARRHGVDTGGWVDPAVRAFSQAHT